MLSFLDIIRGPRRDFDPEREIRHLPLCSAKLTTRDLLTGLRYPVSLPVSPASLAEDFEITPQPLLSTIEGTWEKSNIKVLKAQIRSLERQLGRAKQTVKDRKSDFDRYLDQANKLRARIRVIKRERDVALLEQDNLRTDMDALMQQHFELEAERDNLQEQLEASRARETVLQVERTALQDMLDTVNVLVDELSDENARLRAEQQTASDRIQDLEGKLATVNAENASLKAKLDATTDKIKEGKAELGSVMTELMLEKEKTRSLEAEVAQLKEQLAEKEARLAQEADSFKLERDMYRSQEQHTTARADEENKARLDAEKICEGMRDERDKALARVAELNDIANKQGADIQDLRDTLAAATSRVQTLEGEKDILLQQLEDLQNDLGDAEERYLRANQTVKKLQQDLSKTQGALDEVQAAFPVVSSSKEELIERVVRMQKDNRQLQAAKKTLQNEHFSAVQALDGAKGELFRLRNASLGSISPPGSPSGSCPLPLPLGNGNSFNVAPQLEAGSPPAKSRSIFRFFGKQTDENAKVSSPALA